MVYNGIYNPYSYASNIKRIPVSNVIKQDERDWDRVWAQIGLVDVELEHFINSLKSKDAIIQFQDPGDPEFNQSLYNDDLKQAQDARESAARCVQDATNSKEARAALDRFYSIKDPDKNDPKYSIPTTVTKAYNVKDLYKRLLSLKDKWETAISTKKSELKAQQRPSYKIYKDKLLKDDECFEAIVAIIKHPCVVREAEIINGLSDGGIISKLGPVRARNEAAFDACKTITEYHKQVDDGAFDPETVDISSDDIEQIATTFVSNGLLLDSRSIECIKMKRDHYRDIKATEAIKAELKTMRS